MNGGFLKKLRYCVGCKINNQKQMKKEQKQNTNFSKS